VRTVLVRWSYSGTSTLVCSFVHDVEAYAATNREREREGKQIIFAQVFFFICLTTTDNDESCCDRLAARLRCSRERPTSQAHRAHGGDELLHEPQVQQHGRLSSICCERHVPCHSCVELAMCWWKRDANVCEYFDVQLLSHRVQRLGRPEPVWLDRKRNRPADGPHLSVSSAWSVVHVTDASQGSQQQQTHRRRPELDRTVDGPSKLVSPLSLMFPCPNDVYRRYLSYNKLDGTLSSELTKLTELRDL
jgi:hypothetical protein